ncbi:MAG: 4-(cytidine 5'-diphospho)-2-C-methyl-D-erythritol kinase [Anaerovoracaceae bacterium]
MSSIRLKSYGKINLSIDVLGRLENGYHEVLMVMHQIDLHDDVLIRFTKSNRAGVNITLKTSKYYLPVDRRNLAYRAAELIREKYGRHINGELRIDIKKNIPVAAGLAGGSGNAAAVLLGLNHLWKLNLSLKQLCDIGEELGADVPFTLMGQAKCNKCLGDVMNKHPMATSAALASGIGTTLMSIPAIKLDILLSKTAKGVSTQEVFRNLDVDNISARPNTDTLIYGIEKGDFEMISQNAVNVLEEYTLKKYVKVKETKDELMRLCGGAHVLMSGSGPTVYAMKPRKSKVANFEEAAKILKKKNKETILTFTTF